MAHGLASRRPSFASDFLLRTLEGNGVSTDFVVRTDTATGTAIVYVDCTGDNRIVVVPGANVVGGALPERWESLVAESDLLMMQLETSMTSIVSASQVAARAGVPVLLNPSPVMELPDELLAAVSVLVVNEHEAEALGSEAVARVPHVVTTLGSRGAVYRGPDGVECSAAAPSVEVVDTTGAGDAFTGVFAEAWVRGLGPEEALRRACAAGALAVGVAGASSSPSREAVDRFLESGVVRG